MYNENPQESFYLEFPEPGCGLALDCVAGVLIWLLVLTKQIWFECFFLHKAFNITNVIYLCTWEGKSDKLGPNLKC